NKNILSDSPVNKNKNILKDIIFAILFTLYLFNFLATNNKIAEKIIIPNIPESSPISNKPLWASFRYQYVSDIIVLPLPYPRIHLSLIASILISHSRVLPENVISLSNISTIIKPNHFSCNLYITTD